MSLISRISTALADHRHTDALVLLSEARIRGIQPKLGALQRWVRDCDAASRSDGSFGDEQVLRVLDAILRCTNGDQDVEWNWPGMKTGKGAVIRQDEWKVREPSARDIWAEIKAGTFPRESLYPSPVMGENSDTILQLHLNAKVLQSGSIFVSRRVPVCIYLAHAPIPTGSRKHPWTRTTPAQSSPSPPVCISSRRGSITNGRDSSPTGQASRGPSRPWRVHAHRRIVARGMS